MRPALLLPLALAGCNKALEEDHFCKEVGFAIAGRTVQCTGDEELGNERFEALTEGYDCRDIPVENFGEDTASDIAPQNLFHCSLAIRNLPCEKVAEYGDDLDRWLEASPVCGFIVSAPSGGGAR